MLSIRIAAAGAIVAIAVGGAGGAAAQTAPGSPMPLLQILKAPTEAAPKAPTKATANHHLQRPHISAARIAKKAKFAWKARTRARHILARVDQRPAPAQPAPQTPAADVEPTPNTAPALAVSTNGSQPDGSPVAAGDVGVEPAPGAISPPPDDGLRAIVVDGQTVQVASPNEVNDIDRDADMSTAPEDAALKGDFSAFAPAAPAEPTASAALAGPTAPATMAAAAPQAVSPIGSASWIAKLLAALGGAIAAGSAAWFLIGSAPPRIYTS